MLLRMRTLPMDQHDVISFFPCPFLDSFFSFQKLSHLESGENDTPAFFFYFFVR